MDTATVTDTEMKMDLEMDTHIDTGKDTFEYVLAKALFQRF